jgi:hypothetical protein
MVRIVCQLQRRAGPGLGFCGALDSGGTLVFLSSAHTGLTECEKQNGAFNDAPFLGLFPG